MTRKPVTIASTAHAMRLDAQYRFDGIDGMPTFHDILLTDYADRIDGLRNDLLKSCICLRQSLRQTASQPNTDKRQRIGLAGLEHIRAIEALLGGEPQ